VQTQHDRELKNGRKVTWTEEEVKELRKVMIKLRTKAEIKELATKEEEAARKGSWRELSEVRAYSLLVACFHVG